MQFFVTCCTCEICSCSNSFRCYKSSLRRDRWANTKRCMCSLPAPIIQYKLAISFTHSPPCTHTHTHTHTHTLFRDCAYLRSHTQSCVVLTRVELVSHMRSLGSVSEIGRA